MLSKAERVAAKEQKALEKEEIAFVRKEKQADDEAQKRLEEIYRTTKKSFSERTLRNGWKCQSCGFINFESRLACGRCIEIAPGAKTSILTENIKVAPVSLASDTHLTTVQDRCYRSFNASSKPTSNVSKAPYAAYIGDALPSQQCDVPQDDCDSDDEPSCVKVGGPCTDAEGGEVEGATIVFNTVTKKFVLHFEQIPTTLVTEVNSSVEGSTIVRVSAEVAKATSTSIKLTQGLTSTDSPVLVISGETVATVRDAELSLLRAFADTADALEPQEVTAASAEAKNMKSKQYTHFISIPLGQIPTVREPLCKLLNDIRTISGLPTKQYDADAPADNGDETAAAAPPSNGVHESMFQNPLKFHFTVLMLSLSTAPEIEKAKSLIPEMKAIVDRVFPAGTALTLTGLQVMSHKPADSHVMYVDLDEGSDGRKQLTRLITDIHQLFLREGLAIERDALLGQKIHATILNTKWMKTRKGAGNKEGVVVKGWNRHKGFDARQILKVLGGSSLGSHAPLTMEISKLQGPPGPNGYYKAEAFLEFAQ